MKAGYAPFSRSDNGESALSACEAVQNAIAKTRGNRVFIGSQLSTHVTDWNEAMFRRPMEKGYIVNWEAQRAIWEHSFFDDKTARVLVANPEDTTLLLTEAPNALPALQRNTDEIVMEEWGFGGYARCIGGYYIFWAFACSLAYFFACSLQDQLSTLGMIRVLCLATRLYQRLILPYRPQNVCWLLIPDTPIPPLPRSTRDSRCSAGSAGLTSEASILLTTSKRLCPSDSTIWWMRRIS